MAHSSIGPVIVLTTAPVGEHADQLARTLVEERLAACVNIGPPMVSIYRWKGAIEREPECQLVIKTTGARVPAIQERLKTLHPYELPELLVIDADGSGAYVDWVAAETRADP